jgi:hypothetical protein
MTRRPLAVVRFYVDADLLVLGHVLAQLRADTTFPGDPGVAVRKRIRPPCPVTSPHVADEDWIPVVAAAGWLIITRDAKIQSHRAEIGAVRDYGAKMVNLTAQTAGSTWGQLEVVMRHWRAIDELQEQPGPFIYRASLSKLDPIDLTDTSE